jgi:hypothetical protein
MFTLAICFRVTGRGHEELGTQQWHKGFPKDTREFGVPVRNNRSRGTVEANNLVQEQVSSSNSISIISGGEEMCLLAETVHNNEHSCVSSRSMRKVCEEVHTDGLPVVPRDL